jgi:hypothetical protein
VLPASLSMSERRDHAFQGIEAWTYPFRGRDRQKSHEATESSAG